MPRKSKDELDILDNEKINKKKTSTKKTTNTSKSKTTKVNSSNSKDSSKSKKSASSNQKKLLVLSLAKQLVRLKKLHLLSPPKKLVVRLNQLKRKCLKKLL